MINPREEVRHIGRGDSFKNALSELYATQIDDPVIVEVGTTRGSLGGGPTGNGWATNAWGWYAKKYGGHVHTVDVDADCLEQCKLITTPLKDWIDYHHMTGVEFLETFKGKIDFLYLDGSDDPQEMVDEYLAAEETGKLKHTTLILLDDIAPDYLNVGKGQWVIPLLLNSGWEIVYHDTTPRVMQMLFRRKSG